MAVGRTDLKIFPQAIELSLPASGVYGATSGPGGFTRITLNATSKVPGGLVLPDGDLQLVAINRFADADPFQGVPVTTSPEDLTSYYAIRAYDANGTMSLPEGVTKELTFDISATPVPIWASDVHFFLVYKKSGDPDSKALAVGYLDISEPTPVDVYNNTDKVCLNGQWYTAGSPEAMAIVDTDHDGYADLTDIFPHRIGAIKFQTGTTVMASQDNHILAGTAPLEPGTGMRLGYILTDYDFAYTLDEQVSNLDSRDDWDFSYVNTPFAGTGFVNQEKYGKVGGYGVPYNMRGTKMWWGAGVVYENPEYPEGTSCSWDTLDPPSQP